MFAATTTSQECASTAGTPAAPAHPPWDRDGPELEILFAVKPRGNTRRLSQFTTLNEAFYLSRRDAHGESAGHPLGQTLPTRRCW